MRTPDSWFTFENRCLLCGQKFNPDTEGRGKWGHVDLHRREGYLDDNWEQIKPHPIGFPGPPIGQQPVCSNLTSQG